ncbi:MAG: MarR family winged helix-turn-helix transcriptional regulator [Eubacteriales bacterium]
MRKTVWGDDNILEEDRFEIFSRMTSSALRSIQRIKNKYMEKYGLTGTHTICLRRLFEYPDGLTQRELAIACDIDKAQISRIVAELTQKGYALSVGDERTYNRRFVLSDAGRDVTAEINRTVLEKNRYVSGDIPQEDIERFYSTFEIICENLKKVEEE